MNAKESSNCPSRLSIRPGRARSNRRRARPESQPLDQRGDIGERLAAGGKHPLAALADEAAAGERPDLLYQLGVVVASQAHQSAVDVDVQAWPVAHPTRTATVPLSAPRTPRALSPRNRALRRYLAT